MTQTLGNFPHSKENEELEQLEVKTLRGVREQDREASI